MMELRIKILAHSNENRYGEPIKSGQVFMKFVDSRL
jgi:hypothetical protein